MLPSSRASHLLMAALGAFVLGWGRVREGAKMPYEDLEAQEKYFTL